jgi:PAS domain S-box-containing protein
MSATPSTSLSSAFRPAREAFLLWVLLTTCAVIGVWVGGRYGERKLAEAARTEAANAARAAMIGLDPDLHKRVALNEKMWSEAHKLALKTLIAFHKQYPDVSRVRTFMLDGSGEVVVILDSETVAGDVGMKRPVQPLPLRTLLAKDDPAYKVVEQVLRSRAPAAADDSSYDGYRTWRPGVAPLGVDAAIEADLTSIPQDTAINNLRMWIGTGIGLAVIACGVVSLIYFNVRSSLMTAEAAGGEARQGHEWLQQRNSRLVEALGQLVLHRELESGYMLWDGDTRNLLGSPMENMPMHFEGWLKRISPLDAPRVSDIIRVASHSNRTYAVEYRVHHETEGWRWFRERGVVSFQMDGENFQPTMIDAVLEDITDLKLEQEELAALALIASRTDNAVCLTDPAGRVQWANATFQRLTGHDGHASRGRALGELFAGSPGEGVLQKLLGEAMSGHGGRAEIELLHPEGRSYWTNIEIQPLKDESGAITRLVAIQGDITSAKEFEARLVRAKDAAETADRAKSEFLAVMSHEIRTPLNAVLGFTRLLLDTPLNAQQRDYIDTIRSSGDSLLHLLNDILDFSKMDASSVQLESAPFDLRGCVEDTLDVLIAPATTRGLELIADIALDAPQVVVGDRGRLRQILLNLAGNAVKFTEAGEVCVNVRPVPLHTGDGPAPVGAHVARLRFEVRDSGPGIAPDQQARLFKPFTQADSSATRKHGGTGLGLAISKRLVSLMGGEIGLESTPGVGSTFWFEIPLAVADHQPPLPEALRALEGLRVLVVEKNATQRAVLAAQLSAWGMMVETFGRGRDAVVAGEHRRFDVAVLDAAPPDIDGLGLVERLRRLPRRNIGGIVLVGPPGRLPVGAAGPFDALHRLVKPIHIAALAEVLLRAAPRVARPVVPPAQRAPRETPSAAVAIRTGATLSGPAEEALASAPEPATASAGRVLVADDNANTRKLVKKMLDGIGYESVLVKDGVECVEAVQSGAAFDAILMDIQMPEMDGLAASKAIRDLGSAVPIIALTADAMPDDRARCMAAGMNDYLQKPLRADALVAALARAAEEAA